MDLDLRLVGVDFDAAGISESRRPAFDDQRLAAALGSIRSADPAAGALILATCNRVELYLSGTTLDATTAATMTATHFDAATGPAWFRPTRRASGVHAARHLLRVASGLESPIVGDTQVLGQVRHAIAVAVEAATANGVIRDLGRRAVELGRRARTTTGIAGGASVGAVVAREIERRRNRASSQLELTRLVVLGAGDAARDVARHTATIADARLTIANRSVDAAARLAREVGASAITLDQLPATLGDAHVVVAALGGGTTVLTRELVSACARPDLLVIDLSTPSVTEPSVPAEVLLLSDVQEAAGRSELADLEEVDRMCEATLAALLRDRRIDPVERHIKSLYLGASAHLDAAGADAATRRALRTALHHHVRGLREGPRPAHLAGATAGARS